MAEKSFQTRMVQKNDTSSNWEKAVNFVPKKGELIVYSDLDKVKIGDGTTTVSNLPFMNGALEVVHLEFIPGTPNVVKVEGETDPISYNTLLTLLNKEADGKCIIQLIQKTTESGTVVFTESVRTISGNTLLLSFSLNTTEVVTISGENSSSPIQVTYESIDRFVTKDPITVSETTGFVVEENQIGSDSSTGNTWGAFGLYSHAEGASTALNEYSHVEGKNCIANGNRSHAEGSRAKTTGAGAHAEGFATLAAGTYSHAEGEGNFDNSGSTVVYGTQALGRGSHAEGFCTNAVSDYSHAEGNHTAAGDSAKLPGATANAHAEGELTQALATNAHAEGLSTQALHTASHAAGVGTITGKAAQTVVGQYNIVSNDSAFVVGCGADDNNRANAFEAGSDENNSYIKVGASKITDVEIARAANAVFQNPTNEAVAEGFNTTAIGYAAHAEGNGTTASGGGAHSEGSNTQATASQAHAEGARTVASGNNSHTEGYASTATAFAAHAEGESSSARGSGAHAEGGSCIAYSDHSHVEGLSTTTGSSSVPNAAPNAHAEGLETLANAAQAHAEGRGTQALHSNSHASGRSTITGKAAQTVVGQYNIVSNDSAFVVGCGADDNNRANAFEAGSDSTSAYIKIGTDKIRAADISSKVNVSDIINNVTSTDTDKPLSANMGKELQDEISNLQSRGRFLSLWNCKTGLPKTNPTTSPYTYKTGDYYIVSDRIAGSAVYVHAIVFSGDTGNTYAVSDINISVSNDIGYAATHSSGLIDNLLAAGYTSSSRRLNILSGTISYSGGYDPIDAKTVYAENYGSYSACFVCSENDTRVATLYSYNTSVDVSDTVTTLLNLRPDGSSYTTGVPSTVSEQDVVSINDVYYFDGTNWNLQINSQKEVSFANITGQPSDNTSLAAALNSKVNKTDIINNITSSATDKPLSANMGRELQDEIDNLKARGRFLSLWNCATGKPTSYPTVLPYDYKAGDYYIISNNGVANEHALVINGQDVDIYGAWEDLAFTIQSSNAQNISTFEDVVRYTAEDITARQLQRISATGRVGILNYSTWETDYYTITGVTASYSAETPYNSRLSVYVSGYSSDYIDIYVTGFNASSITDSQSTIQTAKYKPNGSQYTGVASTTVESNAVSINDVYFYDGANWTLQINSQKEVAFANLAGQPTDNANLATALNSKAGYTSPAFTGIPTAPTAAAGTSTTQIATTEFVMNAVNTMITQISGGSW